MPGAAPTLSLTRRRTKIDPTKRYALSGFTSASTYYEIAAGGGEVGSATAGFGLLELLYVPALAGQQFRLANLPLTTPYSGYQLYQGSTNQLQAYLAPTPTTSALAPNRQLTASDCGRFVTWAVAYDPGGRLRAYCDRMEIGTGTTMANYVPATAATRLGLRSDGTSPMHTLRSLGWLGWRGILLPGDLYALYDAIRAGIDLPTSITTARSDAAITALSPLHWFRPDTNTLSSGNLATLPNRGTGGGAMTVAYGTLAAPVTSALFNNQPTLTFNGTQSLVSNLTGAAGKCLTSGMCTVYLVHSVTGTNTQNQVLLSSRGTSVHPSVYFVSYTNGTAYTQINGTNAAGTATISATGPSYAHPLNTLSVQEYVLNTSTAPSILLVSDKRTPSSPLNFNAATPPSTSDPPTPMRISGMPTTGAEHVGELADVLIFDRPLSESERAVVYEYLATRYNYMPITVTHRWSPREAILAGKYGYASAQVAPAIIADSVTSAQADQMVRMGPPTISHLPDPSIDGRVTYGMFTLSTASYFTGPVGAGPQGSTAGHWVAFVINLRTSSSGASQYLMETSSSTNGFRIARVCAPDKFEIYCFGAVNVTSATAIIGAQDRDYPTLVLYHFDGATHTIRLPRGIILSGSGGYAVPPSAARRTMLLTDRPSNTNTTVDSILYRAASGDSPLTPGEIDAMFTAWERQRTLVTPPAKTSWAIDITQDVVGNGGAANGIPATVLDRVGNAHLTRVGSDLQVSPRVERLWTYESTPIYQGAANFASANRYTSSFDDNSLATGFWFAALVFHGVSTPTGLLAGANDSNLRGWELRVGSSNTTMSWAMGDGTAMLSSGTGVTVVSKINLIVCVWDQANARQRVYINRAESGTGVARTTYVPPVATKVTLGDSPPNAGIVGTRTLLGFAQGNGVPSLAQVQAFHDNVAATDVMQTIPGMSASVLVDFTLDGGAPATLTNRAGAGTFARTGLPTLSQLYHRAYAW